MTHAGRYRQEGGMVEIKTYRLYQTLYLNLRQNFGIILHDNNMRMTISCVHDSVSFGAIVSVSLKVWLVS